METLVFSLQRMLCVHMFVYFSIPSLCVSRTRGCECLCAIVGPQARLHLGAIKLHASLTPAPFVYCRLLFQGPPALDKLQTFDGLVAEHSNNMLRSSANYLTIKCGCIGMECEHVYCVDKPERFAAEGGEEKEKESLKAGKKDR